MVWIILTLLLLAALIAVSYIVTRLSRKERNGRIAANAGVTWLTNAVQDKSNRQFFEANGLYKIGIIGYNSFTYILERELDSSDIEVRFCLDSRHRGLSPVPGLPFINSDEFVAHKDEVDALVDVFPLENKECEAERVAVKEFFKGKVIPLDDLLYYTSELKGKA